jgi:protein-tyrosine kinase
MQRAASSGEVDAIKQTNGWPQGALSEQKWANGAPPMPHRVAEAPSHRTAEAPQRAAEPARIAIKAQPVHLDYAKLHASRIVTPDNKSSAAYNEFRSLKRKLIPMTRDPETEVMTRNVIMVTSALPREGKTFTAMSLAICLAAERNLNVILVDGDVVRGSIADYFHGRDFDGLVELLTETGRRIDDTLHPCVELPGLHILFAGRRHEAAPELLASRRMGDICAALSKQFKHSIVLFDTPPVLAASEPAAMAAHAHHLIMLVASGQAGRRQVEAALAEVSSCPSISLLFNRSSEWQRPLSNSSYYYDSDDGADEPQEHSLESG